MNHNKKEAMKKITVIGSGFGGLAIAIRLQAKGFQVTLLEKNEMVGGHAYQFEERGYTFDMGPSLITAPFIIERIYEAAGKKMSDYLDLIYLDPFYRIHFHDGSFLNYSPDSDVMKEQLRTFHPKDAENYDRFIDYTKEVYDAVITDGLGSVPFTYSTLLPFIPRAMKLKALFSTYSVVEKYFTDPRSRFTFSFHPLFIGGSPFRSPAVYLMIPYLEKMDGVWFTKGGMYSLVRALERLFIDIGGTVKTGHEVSEIVIEKGRAKGVVTQDAFMEADAVISNAHFAHTYKDLIKPEHRRKWSDRRVTKMEYSMSSFLIYLGVKKKYPELLQHNLILSKRYKELIEDIFDHKILADDFSMYLHAPSVTDESMAPAGCESMYILVPVPNLAGKIDWNEMEKPYADKILTFLEKEFGLTDLKEHIEVQRNFTPLDFARDRNNYLGSAWGLEPRLTQTATFRPGNRSEDIRNLYLVGASTHPGAGVPGALLTAEATENAILKDI
ncbi:phytoene desaturase [candidate division KSB1 bacterium]|nr:phytoene desaturase [candidate division KSB1 bacterium]